MPFAIDYGDGYFGSDNPRAEVQDVFIEANGLPDRFSGRRHFAIGETGFGSGLNLLLALAQWRRHAPPDAFLSLLSLEAHPLSPEDLATLHQHLGLDDADSRALREQYPPPVPGLHRIEFPGGRAVLTLGLGDAAPLLARVRGRIDAWFLDGFAPRSNPALWNTGVFRQIARLSAPGATFGTYTAAGQVRRDLEGVGFSVQRVPGHGRKRERLTGTLEGPCAEPPAPATPAPRRVAVVGAGLAGLATAHALHRRGVHTALFDPAGAGGGASGNPAAVLLPNLHPRDAELNRLAVAGMRQSRELIAAMEVTTGKTLRLASGVAFHGISAHGQKRVTRLRKAGREATGLLFDPEGPRCADAPHLYYSDGLAVDMGALCRALARGLPAIRQEAVTGIQLSGDTDGVQLQTDTGSETFDAVVLANAAGPGLPLCPEQAGIATVTGQMTRVQAALPDWGGFVATGQGYCIPAADGTAWIGATYRRTASPGVRQEGSILAEDDAANLRHLAWVPGLEAPDTVQVLDHWAGERAVVRDRLPLVGPSRMDAGGRVQLNLAHGSRGLLYAPLAAEWLADHLLGLVEPLEAGTAARFSPGRFTDQTPGASGEA
ncbi:MULTISPECIES: tRNA (5-methylaminomethyl-2-thiouridine)(34)-methyltransferase MnmD [unclassified Thioalkalivibrio]|uniref:tRNA (5-methylaminomethyl-2-thiouridine)(34)-methyltransferase MnmD n=1 Tax=unclassified Thioalkalivibrio TaxID=2621013 RepID=UPI000381E13E|nr:MULTISPECIES: tRNA (5-methylaminomethyl-2-thiouridine)(34)-methyltransferase MnmD [unclassified Thioalkalivibrio]